MIKNDKNSKRRPKRVVNIDKTAKETQKNTDKKSGNLAKGFYYSFLTIILLLCLVQITVSAVVNISKVVLYKAKIIQIQKNRDAALALNEQLKDSISNFSNVTGLEEIARNNLKMSSDDELLVIINTPKDNEEKKEKSGFMSFTKHD